MDIPGIALQRIRTENDLKAVVAKKSANVIVVYNPMCGACRRRMPEFDQAVKAMAPAQRRKFWAFNATLDDPAARHAMFQRVTGAPIEYYPMVIGLSKAGRVVAYNAPFTTEALANFLMALERT